MAACANRAQHRHLWVVLARNGAWNYYPNGRWVEKPVWKPSWQSEVYCPACPTRWRTSAQYVGKLPDAADASSTVPTRATLTPKEKRVWDLIEYEPMLAELTYVGNGGLVDGNRFLADVGRRLVQYGGISEKQQEACLAGLRRAHKSAAAADADARWRASLGPSAAPRGRVHLQGVIEEVWEENLLDAFTGTETSGNRWRMRVLTEDGWRVECTIPASLQRTVGTQIKGRRITNLNVILKPKHDDPTKAWGTYPSQKARLLDEEAT